MIALFWIISSFSCLLVPQRFLVCMLICICMEDWPEVSLLLSGQEPLLVLFSFLWDFDLWPLCGQGFPIRLDYLAGRPQGSTHGHLSSAGIPSTTHVWLVMCMVGTELRSDACTASTLLSPLSNAPHWFLCLNLIFLLLLTVLHHSHVWIVWLDSITKINKE